MKVLIVDDSKAMRMIIRRMLRQAGQGNHTVLEASNGVEALEILEESTPELILADWNMPEMNGFELLQKVKQAGNKAKFGFVTSESTEDVRDKAIAAGAEFLLTKPFNAVSFDTALSTVLS